MWGTRAAAALPANWIAGRPIEDADSIRFDVVDGCNRHRELGDSFAVCGWNELDSWRIRHGITTSQSKERNQRAISVFEPARSQRSGNLALTDGIVTDLRHTTGIGR